MAFQCHIDEFGTQTAAASGIPTVAQGRAIHVSGRVVDPERGVVPRRIFGAVDDSLIVHATRIAKDGFNLAVATRDLLPRRHMLSIVAEDPDGLLWRVEQRSFVVTPADSSPAFPRVIVIGAPKSGSTYTWLVLTKYFGTEELTPGALFRGTQPLLDDWTLERLHGRSYVAHMHLSPNSFNLRAVADESITPIVLWRNLGDAIVSNDDHFRRIQEAAPDDDGTKYLAMTAQVRYQFLIRFHLAEYISFYLGWRRAGQPVFRYEEMVANENTFFERIITRIADAVDAERLQIARAAAGSDSQTRQNKNVGKVGRSTQLFTDETKAFLEETLRNYFVPLDELIAELPWR
ncbi:MAG TPA: hypothetical protein VMF11_04065 [Candidatus Baltobacteraceae bacterium]|nr:hypothetical protein [Candidatus Baltobacteraceae bacterium]